MSNYQVIIPEWENYYTKSKKTKVKYWLYKDKEKLPLKYREIIASRPVIVLGKAYCCGENLERFIKNTKKAGTPNIWILNGQDLYSGIMHHTVRKKVAGYFHAYFSNFIKAQLDPIELAEGEYLSISCDIYEIKRGNMPDASNMWILEKFFEDALQDCGIIEDDGPNVVLESGRKRYHWVKEEKERKLVFNINIIRDE